MTRKPQPGWWIYKEQMDFLCHGDALWEPAPTHSYTRISIGDVGFIRRGQFHLLFSAGCPLGERQPGEDVPTTFEELSIGTPVFGQPRLPVCLRTDTVREVGAGVGATVSTTLPLEPGASFSFELTGNRGAALVTKYQTYRGDSLRESAFEKYTKRHYESWVAFARHKEYGNDVQPVLVSGFDMTKDFAMVAYSNESTSLESDLTITVPMLASASASAWGTWRTKCSPHTNHGPQQCILPLSDRAIDFPSSQSDARSIPNEFNQVIRAGAGSHDLGSGDNRGDTFPELTVESDADLTMTNDEDDTGDEPDIVVRNTPYDVEYDSWGAVADYVFQNPDAMSVLLHHRDLAAIREGGGSGDISSLLAAERPHIEVEDGVGRIVCRENRRSTKPFTASPHPTSAVQHRNGGNGSRDIHPVPTRIDISDGIHLPQSLPPITHEDLAKLGVEPRLIPFVISTALRAERSPDDSPYLTPDDAECLIEILDKVVSSATVNPNLKYRCIGVLRKVSPAHGILPKSYLSTNVTLSSNMAHASGGFADVWVGRQDGKLVCVKAVRIETAPNPERIKRRFYREIVGWKHLSHPNVLPFLGVSESLFPFSTISPWLPNGDVIKYIRKHRGANRLHLLTQAASGLEYLHSQSVVHGGITPGNILITEEGTARIGDFGIAGILADSTVVQREGTTSSKPGDTRYMAPELLDPQLFGFKHSNPSRESDVYAFAMVAYEVLTGMVPYGTQKESFTAFSIVSGNRPPRPSTITANRWVSDPIWKIIRWCWNQTPQSRLSAEVLHRGFAGLDVELEGTPVTMDGEDIMGGSPASMPASEDPTPIKRDWSKKLLAKIGFRS